MPIHMSGNVVFTGSNRFFNIMTNLTPWFEIGDKDGNDVWLAGHVAGDDFVFNGRLYLSNGELGTVIDNFPKGPTPKGWTQHRKLDVEGYELIDPRGETIFGYHVDGNLCFVDVNLYKSDGSLAAHPGQGGLVIQGVPFRM